MIPAGDDDDIMIQVGFVGEARVHRMIEYSNNVFANVVRCVYVCSISSNAFIIGIDRIQNVLFLFPLHTSNTHTVIV